MLSFIKDTNIISNDKKIIDNLRGLAIDTINEANSGHSGIALGAAPIIYSLFAYHLKVDKEHPRWINRDRFVLSAGHGSALLYSALTMLGMMKMDDLKQFRKIDSISPGHPEYGDFVDMTTGPLGQGFASSVGMAIGEANLRATFGKDIIDNYIYTLCGDGDLQEGISYEAASLAGHLKLNKLIVLYDSNDITLDGELKMSFSENIKMRFEAMNWNYQLVSDGESFEAINEAINKAKTNDKPSIIEIKTVIGKYSNLENTHKIHGVALSSEEISKIKDKLAVRDMPFTLSDEAVSSFVEKSTALSEGLYTKWEHNLEKLDSKKRNDLNYFIHNTKAINISEFDDYESLDEEATRVSSGKVLNAIAKKMPVLIGGSADLSSSTFVKFDMNGNFDENNRGGRNINFGVREHAMGAIANGLATYGFTPVVSTFLAFSDYLKPALRISALSNLPVIYAFTHDSISLGEDGPTHQPIEQLVSLRATPNVDVYRPADLNEVLGTYKTILKNRRPAAIALSRNKVKVMEATSVSEVAKGAYTVYEGQGPLDAIIISSGEELHIAAEVYQKLSEKGYSIRLVSMPSIELFEAMDEDYKSSLLYRDKTFVIEASSSYSWQKYVPDSKHLFTIDTFGASGKKEEVLEKFGFNSEKIAKSIETML